MSELVEMVALDDQLQVSGRPSGALPRKGPPRDVRELKRRGSLVGDVLPVVLLGLLTAAVGVVFRHLLPVGDAQGVRAEPQRRGQVRRSVKVLDEIRQAQLDAAAQPGGVAVDGEQTCGEQTCGEQPGRIPRVDDRSTAAPSRSTSARPTHPDVSGLSLADGGGHGQASGRHHLHVSVV